ncbi:unnamed protein product [Prorocentrum cordatum]|uniref:Uncharacterized protein n=1 Tax=Prorocentrum cordatum TaxID=2364126 RepID=A0ABN9XHB5_9DINO|nr:unnamed protein product [Polarella glacialis]
MAMVVKAAALLLALPGTVGASTHCPCGSTRQLTDACRACLTSRCNAGGNGIRSHCRGEAWCDASAAGFVDNCMLYTTAVPQLRSTLFCGSSSSYCGQACMGQPTGCTLKCTQAYYQARAACADFPWPEPIERAHPCWAGASWKASWHCRICLVHIWDIAPSVLEALMGHAWRLYAQRGVPLKDADLAHRSIRALVDWFASLEPDLLTDDVLSDGEIGPGAMVPSPAVPSRPLAPEAPDRPGAAAAAALAAPGAGVWAHRPCPGAAAGSQAVPAAWRGAAAGWSPVRVLAPAAAVVAPVPCSAGLAALPASPAQRRQTQGSDATTVATLPATPPSEHRPAQTPGLATAFVQCASPLPPPVQLRTTQISAATAPPTPPVQLRTAQISAATAPPTPTVQLRTAQSSAATAPPTPPVQLRTAQISAATASAAPSSTAVLRALPAQCGTTAAPPVANVATSAALAVVQATPAAQRQLQQLQRSSLALPRQPPLPHPLVEEQPPAAQTAEGAADGTGPPSPPALPGAAFSELVDPKATPAGPFSPPAHPGAVRAEPTALAAVPAGPPSPPAQTRAVWGEPTAVAAVRAGLPPPGAWGLRPAVPWQLAPGPPQWHLPPRCQPPPFPQTEAEQPPRHSSQSSRESPAPAAAESPFARGSRPAGRTRKGSAPAADSLGWSERPSSRGPGRTTPAFGDSSAASHRSVPRSARLSRVFSEASVLPDGVSGTRAPRLSRSSSSAGAGPGSDPVCFADLEISGSMGDLQQQMRQLHRRSVGLEDALRASRSRGAAAEAENAELRQLLRGLHDRVQSLEGQVADRPAGPRPRTPAGGASLGGTMGVDLDAELALRRRSRFRSLSPRATSGSGAAAPRARGGIPPGRAGRAGDREPWL